MFKQKLFVILIIVLSGVDLLAKNVHTRIENLPLYEFGVGGGYFVSPYYQGSEQNQIRTLGIPFFIYRGKILKSDRDGGTRAEFYKEKNFRFDLTVSGGFSAKSTEVDARQGMPDLDYMGAIGPRLKWIVYSSHKWGSIKLSLPLLAAYVSDFKKTQDIGFIFHPNMTYNVDRFIYKWWDLFFRIGAIWAEDRYMDYYYDVKPQYANIQRDIYEARSGLLEKHIDAAAAFRINSRWRLFLGIQYSDYSQVANRESPLLTAKDTLGVGIGLIWTVYESEKKAGQWL